MSKTSASSTGWVEGMVDWSYTHQPLSLKSPLGLNLDVYFLFLIIKTHLVLPMLFSLFNEKPHSAPRLVLVFFTLTVTAVSIHHWYRYIPT